MDQQKQTNQIISHTSDSHFKQLTTVNDETIIKSGYLVKRGNASCACSSSKVHFYLTHASLIQGIQGRSIVEKFDMNQLVVQTKGEGSNDFVIISCHKKLKLKAKTKSEKDEWVDAIKSVVQKLHDQKQDLPELGVPRRKTSSNLHSMKHHHHGYHHHHHHRHHNQVIDNLEEKKNNEQEVKEELKLIEKIEKQENNQNLSEEQQDQQIEVSEHTQLTFTKSSQFPHGYLASTLRQSLILRLEQPHGEQAVELDVNEIDFEQNFLYENQIEEDRNQSRQDSSSSFSSDSCYDPIENPDPPTRDVLPYFKDPNDQASFWTVLKDCIGKDLTKVSMPVYFNHPLSMMQKVASGFEYNYLLDEAMKQESSLKRMAYIASYLCPFFNHNILCSTKPFNPLLGETFEFIGPNYKVIGESISHHPIIVGINCQGDSGYDVSWVVRPNKPKFSGTHIKVPEYYKSYIQLKPFNEVYEIKIPTFAVHNIIFGRMYIDVTEQCIIRNISKEGEKAVINYSPRKSKTPFRVSGEIFDKDGKAHYKIEGRIDQFVEIIDNIKGEKERVWQMEPYSENQDFQYGFSKYQIQLNYLPNYMVSVLPPTDSRFRPDQRAQENGDIKEAIAWKDKLENKQRIFMKYMEKNKIEYKPRYFEEYKNSLEKDEIYYRYNGRYWEQDRKNRNWQGLPDIFSDTLSPELQEFTHKK